MAAKSLDKPTEGGTMDLPMESEPKAAAPTIQMQQPQPKVDDSRVDARYANFCRVTGTPEEVIVDLRSIRNRWVCRSTPSLRISG